MDTWDSHLIDPECFQSGTPPHCTLDCRSSGSAPWRAVFLRPEGPLLTALGSRCYHSTDLGVLDVHRSGAAGFPEVECGAIFMPEVPRTHSKHFHPVWFISSLRLYPALPMVVAA